MGKLRLIAPLFIFFLLLGGCASDREATTASPPTSPPTSMSATVRASSTPTPTPEPTPTVYMPRVTMVDGWIESPCGLSHHGRPDGDRQTGFLQWSPDGSSLILDLDREEYSEQAIWEIGADGSYTRRVANPKAGSDGLAPLGFHADLSPDGQHLVYSTCEYEKEAESLPSTDEPLPVYELAVISIDGGEPERLTESVAADHYPAWSPDGSRIAYIGMDRYDIHYSASGPWAGAARIMTLNPTGKAHRHRALNIPPPSRRAPVWSPDGRHLAVVVGVGGPGSIHVVDVDDDTASSSSIVVGETSISPTWSPDGTQLAFAENPAKDHTETSTVYIVNRDGSGEVAVPGTGGWISQMAWHPDGSEILVAETGAAGGLWTVTPDGQTFRSLYQPGDNSYPMAWAYGLAWSPDGSRFAIRTIFVGLLLATATREGDHWRILAVGDHNTDRGFRLCNLPAQGPEYSSTLDTENHCEPAGEQNP